MRERFRVLVSPLQQRECRVLLTAQVVSGLGDWAGRIALAVLVYERSDSAMWAAAVTVVTLLPWLGPGQMLATLSDRVGRVRVMIVTDVTRAGLFALMLIPQPVWSLLLLAFLTGLCVPPFSGARGSASIEVIRPDLYPASLILFGVAGQVEILAGYALGGIFVAVVGAQTAMALNAMTFLFSAIVLRSLRGTAADVPNKEAAVGWNGLKDGIQVWRIDPVCARALLIFLGVNMFMILPETLVVPVTAELGSPDALVGVFAALVAVGSLVGILFAPSGTDHIALLRRTAVIGMALSLITGVLFSVSNLPLTIAAAFIVSGMVDAVAVPTYQVVGERLPAAGRAAALTFAQGLVFSAQVASITVAVIIAGRSSARLPLGLAMFAAGGVCLYAALRPVKERPPMLLDAAKLSET